MIAFVLYPGLTVWAPQFQTTVVTERIESMDTDLPPKLVPARTFEELPNPFVAFIPGGGLPTIKATGNPAIRDYLLSTSRTA